MSMNKEVEELLDKLGQMEDAPLIWINKKIYEQEKEIENLQQRIDKSKKICLQLRTHLSNWLFKEGYMGGERTKKFLDEIDEILGGKE